MPRPRKSLIDLSQTSYYHCISRCVRRAFLCGQDITSGKSYEHRRQWVEDRLLFLSGIFCIDVCAYAVMSNHTHIVLRVNQQQADTLSVTDILVRWHKLFSGMLITRKYLNSSTRNAMSDAEIHTVNTLAQVYRARLFDISWFMRLLNENIARQANKEDGCTGHFWEGRFKSQALKDEASVAACMAYVDLNPVRARQATSPEKSAFTSINHRIKASKNNQQPLALLPFAGKQSIKHRGTLPFHFEDYLALLKYTASHTSHEELTNSKEMRNPILQRTGLDIYGWLTMATCIEKVFKTAVSGNKWINQPYHPKQDAG